MAKKPRHARAHNTPGNQDDLNKDAQVNLVKIIELVPLARLKPWARNARTHSKKQIRQIAKSIETFGFTNPALIDAADMILAGHGRVEAAKLLGMDAIPCVRLEHMTQAQVTDAPRAGTKQALMVALLSKESGASLQDLMTATGWLHHTTRAALTGLRKRGFPVERHPVEGGGFVYQIASGGCTQAATQARAA